MMMPKYSRYRSAQVMYAVLCLYYGLAFMLAGLAGMTAMEPDDYGTLAVSYEIEAMAGVQLFAATLLMMGIILNGRWKWSPAVRMGSALCLAGLCGFLSYSAFPAPNGWPVGIYCSGFAMAGLIVAWWGLVDLRAVQKWGSDGTAA